MTLKLKIQLTHPEASIPFYATEGSAAFDICVLEADIDPIKSWVHVKTGLKIAVPEGHALFLYPRSGLAAKYGLQLRNGVGVVDSDYRGEIQLIMEFNRIHTIEIFGSGAFDPGARIAQGIVMPIPSTTIEVVDSLDETVRGEGGFGSTGV